MRLEAAADYSCVISCVVSFTHAKSLEWRTHHPYDPRIARAASFWHMSYKWRTQLVSPWLTQDQCWLLVLNMFFPSWAHTLNFGWFHEPVLVVIVGGFMTPYMPNDVWICWGRVSWPTGTARPPHKTSTADTNVLQPYRVSLQRPFFAMPKRKGAKKLGWLFWSEAPAVVRSY